MLRKYADSYTLYAKTVSKRSSADSSCMEETSAIQALMAKIENKIRTSRREKCTDILFLTSDFAR